MTTYIHELPDWPHFTWDERAVADRLASVRHRQGRLAGRMEALGFTLRAEANLQTVTEDVITTSAIEGEAKLAKCSQDTALRDIDDLVGRGILAKDAAGGRSTSYSLVDAEISEGHE